MDPTDANEVLAKFREMHAARCAQYPTQYTGEDRDSCPKFLVRDLVPAGLKPAAKAKARKALQVTFALLEQLGQVVRSREEYVLATPGVLAEAARVKFEHDRANALAGLLGGEAEHFTRGSFVTFTVGQAEDLRAKLGALQEKVERLAYANRMADALNRGVGRG